MISPELAERVRRIELRASHLVDEIFAGRYRSAFRGQGIEFEEVRPYEPGDDARTIDWKVTARSRSPYVKLFREERELTLHLLVDASGSQSFGSAGQTKLDLAVDVAAMLAFAALRNNDKVGLTLFTDRIERTVRPSKGRRHVLRLIRDLLEAPLAGRGTDLELAIDNFHRGGSRRCVLVIISDFFGADCDRALHRAAGENDVVPIVTRDRLETELPPGALLRAVDPESGRRFVVDAFSGKRRRQYKEEAAAHERRMKRLFSQLRLDWLELWTGEDPVPALRRFFDRRGNR